VQPRRERLNGYIAYPPNGRFTATADASRASASVRSSKRLVRPHYSSLGRPYCDSGRPCGLETPPNIWWVRWRARSRAQEVSGDNSGAGLRSAASRAKHIACNGVATGRCRADHAAEYGTEDRAELITRHDGPHSRG